METNTRFLICSSRTKYIDQLRVDYNYLVAWLHIDFNTYIAIIVNTKILLIKKYRLTITRLLFTILNTNNGFIRIQYELSSEQRMSIRLVHCFLLILGEGCSIGSVHTAGDLLIPELVSSVVDGHPPVGLRPVRLGPHYEGLGGGENGAGELVTQHLAAVTLLGVLLCEVIKVLASRDVQVVVITLNTFE